MVKRSRRVEIASRHSHQELDSLVNRVDCPDVELACGDGTDHVMTQHKVRNIASGNANALCSGQALEFAGIVETLDLIIDGTHDLNFAMLVHRAGHGHILAERHIGERAEQAAKLGHRGTVALDPAVGLFEDQAGGKGQRVLAGVALAQVTLQDQHALVVDMAAHLDFALDVDNSLLADADRGRDPAGPSKAGITQLDDWQAIDLADPAAFECDAQRPFLDQRESWR